MAEGNTTVLNLSCGPVVVRHENSVLHARGIPYARAGRFEKPSTVGSWTTAKDYTHPASICPQVPSRLANVNGDITSSATQSEDCLHLTVAAPKGIGKNLLPVIVYFHGGAYATGGGDLDAYNPSPLAETGEVVVVTVTYRLGHFGYLAVPGWTPANLGLLDQIAALEWVQRNIGGFGGDAGRVTISGQSAGGDAMLCLLICEPERTRGLFHRVIVQSAPVGRFYEPEGKRNAMTAAMGERVAAALNRAGGVMSTREYLDLQPELIAVAKSIHPTLMQFGPVLGQEPLPPRSELEPRLREVAQRIPVMIGYTKDEGSAFADMDPSDTSADVVTKTLFRDGADRLHAEMAEVTTEAPMYNFVWHPEGNRFGAAHCIELPFLYGTKEAWASAPMLEGCDSAKMIETLGPQVKNLWVAFAKGKKLGKERFVIDSDFQFKAY